MSGTAAQRCTVSGMFPSGRVGQREHYSCEPTSPTNGGPQKTSVAAEQSLHHREPPACMPEDYHPHRLSQVDSTDSLGSWSQSSSTATFNPESVDEVVENSLPKHNEQILDDDDDNEEEEEEGTTRGGSGYLVEHLLKELKGINKIQEEISDLRQYLTSVRGSVDEASYCVDTVLSEIEELYCGASAAPLPGPAPQAGHTRRGSLGRQNAVTSPCAGFLPSCMSPKHQHVYQVPLPLSERANQHDRETNLWTEERHSCCKVLENQQGFGQSTSSLSSCLSPMASCLSEADAWPLFDGGWSEEDVGSEELQIRPDLWNRWATGEAEGCPPGLEKSSERLDWSLFVPYGITPFGFSGPVDCGLPRVPREEADFRSRHSPNFPRSGSSGYHTIHAGLDQCCGGLSGSEMLVSDCVEPEGNRFSSWRDAALLGSAHSLDRNWMEPSSSSRDDAQDPLLTKKTDPTGADLLPDAGFDTTTFSKAMLTFRSALKGALKKLEATEPLDDAVQDFRSTAMASIPVQESVKDPNEEEADLKDTQDSVCSSTADRVPSSIAQGSPLEPLDLPTASCSPIGTPEQKGESPSGDPPWSAEPSADDVRLSPISENQALDQSSPMRPSDAGHRERIANFQRILREKRQIRQRLSRSAQDSQGSQSSQCSQSSQSSQCRDEFIAGIEQNDL